ncbi:MAG: vWA domain-containing protein, partial [Planctomycetaceae bacterium]
ATPKDQVALLASASEASEEAIETFAIETAQPNEAEPTMAEPVYETSAVGSMVINDVNLDISAVTAVMTSNELMEGSPSSSDRRMLQSISKEAESKMQFCGVDGGGNHFVYLVDSSGSMRDGFYSARTELLASIDQLQPDQRFYVVFFDEEPEYMRIHDPNVDEPASVMATPENKRRLRKWAMKVQMNPGKAPYEVLPFALRLRPDVIFLLSDGEFPSRIEDILQAQNHQDNLFGESRPICIVHTIRYHGVEGETGRKAEATMVKIAKENGGQYRHVPKPK